MGRVSEFDDHQESMERSSTADELIRQLVALRHIRGLSQTEVAARMGTSQSALARLESGRSDLRLSTLARFADALDVDIGFALRTRDESMDGPVGGSSNTG